MSKIAVCASGEGANFESIVNAAREGRLRAEIVGLITNRPDIGAIKRAERLNIPTATISRKTHDDLDLAMSAQLKAWQADWLVLAGFLALIGPQTLKMFPRTAVNIHPALLPKHGGAGMYGDRVHTSVLKAGDKETGVTVHLLDSHYDEGRVLVQERVPVLPGDTVATLRERVKALEIELYPRVLNDLVTGRITTG